MSDKTKPDSPLGDLSNARRFVTEHGEVVRRVSRFRRWYVWDSRVWAPDDNDSSEVSRLAKATVDGLGLDVLEAPEEDRDRLYRHWKQSASARGLRCLLEVAATESQVSVSTDDLDADPYALVVSNGVVDLRSGQIRRHDPADLETRLVATDYHPGAGVPAGGSS